MSDVATVQTLTGAVCSERARNSNVPEERSKLEQCARSTATRRKEGSENIRTPDSGRQETIACAGSNEKRKGALLKGACREEF